MKKEKELNLEMDGEIIELPDLIEVIKYFEGINNLGSEVSDLLIAIDKINKTMYN